jgi:hypothetical protein
MKIIKLMGAFVLVFYIMLFVWVMLTTAMVQESFQATPETEIYENAFDECMRENLLNDVMCDKFANDIAYGDRS